MTQPRLTRAIGGVILDMDGTLLDTESIYVRSYMQAAAELGHDLPHDFLHAMIGAPGPQFQQQIRAKLGPDFPYAPHRTRYLELRTEFLAAGIALKPGVNELLDAIDFMNLPKAIATAATRENAESHLTQAGIRGRFSMVLTRDDVEHPKPRPDVFLAAAAAIGRDPADCIAVEDSVNGVRAAHAAGMMTIMVPDIAHPDAEIASLCVAVLTDLHEVRRLIWAS